ncbi:MAG TPA: nucleotidyl transferase AbiEii/AbiGii toxin family protein [Polyangiaceae bacterium]|nr:nucleotidyl transferase AbiEii/AbiGii toxin family protein [Polyangiaceae bacterium]
MEQLQRAAAEGGYALESYEKAHILVRLLEALRTHPFLGSRMALKGGTALNLFVLDLPRLSVDIDLNYVGAAEREKMLSDRPRVEQALQQVAGRTGLQVKRVPTDHAGGKWRLTYASALSRSGTIEVDVNFMLRTPLWSPRRADSHAVGGERASQVLLLDDHELAAGKLAALVARSASRDLFDARELLRRPGWDRSRLRLGFVVYGGLNRVDWRNITVENVQATARDVDAQLVPMLRLDVRPAPRDMEAWTRQLLQETRQLMAAVLPLAPQEREFLERLNGAGDIVPELLTTDTTVQMLLRDHPGLRWKALNVKKHLGAPSGDPEEP